jgi:hypothetical protein
MNATDGYLKSLLVRSFETMPKSSASDMIVNCNVFELHCLLETVPGLMLNGVQKIRKTLKSTDGLFKVHFLHAAGALDCRSLLSVVLNDPMCPMLRKDLITLAAPKFFEINKCASCERMIDLCSSRSKDALLVTSNVYAALLCSLCWKYTSSRPQPAAAIALRKKWLGSRRHE